MTTPPRDAEQVGTKPGTGVVRHGILSAVNMYVKIRALNQGSRP